MASTLIGNCKSQLFIKVNNWHHLLRLDILVEKWVIIEVKSTIEYNPIFEAQTLTYLRLTNLKLGIVINFGERFLKDGIHRVVNDLK